MSSSPWPRKTRQPHDITRDVDLDHSVKVVCAGFFHCGVSVSCSVGVSH